MYSGFVVITDDAVKYAQQLTDVGYDEWLEDECIQNGSINCFRFALGKDEWQPWRVRAKMLFNYNVIPGTVFEIIEYDDTSWFRYVFPQTIRPNHLIQMVEVVPDIQMYLESNFRITKNSRLVQRFRTSEHTNPLLVNAGRWFDHAVFDTFDKMGFVMKAMDKHYG